MANLSTLQVYGDRVLIKPTPPDHYKSIIIPEYLRPRQDQLLIGEVVAVGPGDKGFWCATCNEPYKRVSAALKAEDADKIAYVPTCKCLERGKVPFDVEFSDDVDFSDADLAPKETFYVDPREGRHPMHVKAGDKVLYWRSPASQVPVGNETYEMPHEQQHVVAVIEDCDGQA